MFLRHKVRLSYNCVEVTHVVIVVSLRLTEIVVQLVFSDCGGLWLPSYVCCFVDCV